MGKGQVQSPQKQYVNHDHLPRPHLQDYNLSIPNSGGARGALAAELNNESRPRPPVMRGVATAIQGPEDVAQGWKVLYTDDDFSNAPS